MKKMKFLLVAIVVVGILNNGFAQTTWNLAGNTPSGSQFVGSTGAQDLIFKTNNTERARILSGGNFGIGINSPTSALHVKGSGLSAYITIDPTPNAPNPNDVGIKFGRYIIYQQVVPANTGGLHLGPITAVGDRGIHIYGDLKAIRFGKDLTNTLYATYHFDSTVFNKSLQVGYNGSLAPAGYNLFVEGKSNFTDNVVIGSISGFTAGTPFPSPYKLFVAGGIITEKLKVSPKTTADWSDYVFEKNYKLRSLSEVEKFVTENKHLPGVPSAQEVVDNGIDVAKMDAKLLEKIEELTLYMLQQQKQLEAQQKQIEELKVMLK